MTPYPDLTAVLHRLVAEAQAVLGPNFVGAYLQGSFATGDGDAHSDVDFIIAIQRDITEAELPALQAMHGRIHDLESPWARHLDGSHIPLDILRRHDPTRSPLLYLDNGSRALVRSDHDNTLVVRWMLREHGVVLAGLPPADLIDPIPPAALAQEVRTTIHDWAKDLFANPGQMNSRWYQPFAVLSYCRMLHTLHTGRIESKLAGARWAQSALDPRWSSLIQRAWAERNNPSLKVHQPADPNDLKLTIDFIRYALGKA